MFRTLDPSKNLTLAAGQIVENQYLQNYFTFFFQIKNIFGVYMPSLENRTREKTFQTTGNKVFWEVSAFSAYLHNK